MARSKNSNGSQGPNSKIPRKFEKDSFIFVKIDAFYFTELTTQFPLEIVKTCFETEEYNSWFILSHENTGGDLIDVKHLI